MCPDDEDFLHQLIEWKIPFVFNLSLLNSTDHERIFLFITQQVYDNVYRPATQTPDNPHRQSISKHPWYTEIITPCTNVTTIFHTVVLPNSHVIKGYKSYRARNPYLFDPLAYSMKYPTLIDFPAREYKRIAQHLQP